MADDYGATFRDAYALLHGGRPHEAAPDAGRRPGESLGDFLSRTRVESLGRAHKQLLAAAPPEGLADVHRLLLELLDNAMQADEALARQVAAYRCGNFQESVQHSDRLGELVSASARLDRELIRAIGALPTSTKDQLGIATEPGGNSQER